MIFLFNTVAISCFLELPINFPARNTGKPRSPSSIVCNGTRRMPNVCWNNNNQTSTTATEYRAELFALQLQHVLLALRRVKRHTLATQSCLPCLAQDRLTPDRCMYLSVASITTKVFDFSKHQRTKSNAQAKKSKRKNLAENLAPHYLKCSVKKIIPTSISKSTTYPTILYYDYNICKELFCETV